jgi:hypothetical protein
VRITDEVNFQQHQDSFDNNPVRAAWRTRQRIPGVDRRI